MYKDGASRLVPNAFGEYLTPSVVSIDEDGEVLVGKAAKERLITHPERTAAAFKRAMGTGRTFSLAGREFLPEELSALEMCIRDRVWFASKNSSAFTLLAMLGTPISLLKAWA